MGLTEQQRKEVYHYAVKIGFIIIGVDDWCEDKKTRKLKQYMRQGFRIVDYGDTFKVINILEKEIPDRKRENIEKLYEWIINT